MKKVMLVGLLGMQALSGCAAMRAAMARDRSIEAAVTNHTYQRPCQEVWQAARTVLFGQNYQVKSADAAAGLTLETDWKFLSDGSSSRYLFQGVSTAPETCKVQATQATKTQRGDAAMNRDWRMEWNLLKQVEMDAANRIEADANAAGEAARNQG